MAIDKFVSRHIGPREDDIKEMLKVIGVQSLDELIDQTVPANIRLEKPLNLSNGLTEREYYRKILKCQTKGIFAINIFRYADNSTGKVAFKFITCGEESSDWAAISH